MRQTKAPQPEWLPTLLAERDRYDAEAAVTLTQAHEAAGRGEITAAEEEQILRTVATLTPRFPDHYTLGPCPPWCTTDHVKGLGHDTLEGERYHEADMLADRVPGVSVLLMVRDDLESGVRSAPMIRVDQYDVVDAEVARVIHAGLLAAILAAEVWNAGAR